MGLTKDDKVVFYPESGGKRNGVVVGRNPAKGRIGVLLEGDPFAVILPVERLRKEGSKEPSPQAQKKPEKEKEAMAKKSGSKKVKKEVSIENPYREGSSMAFLFDLLVEGGVVEDIAKKLVKKFPIKVRAEGVEDEDAHIQNEAVYRTLDVLKAADKAGLPTSKEGKGRKAEVKIG